MDQLEKLRADIKANLDERAAEQTKYDEARTKLDDTTRAATERGDGVLNSDETNALKAANDAATTARDEMTKLDEARGQMEQRVDSITAAEEAREAALASAEKYGGTATTQIRVGKEEDVYRPEGKYSFFRDMYAARYASDPLAAERQLRHARSHELETRDAATSAFAGLVVPQYLVDEFAPIARQGRPFADFIGSRDLPPEGMTLNVPRGNTGTIVVSQTSENSAVGEQDYGAEDIVVPVRTIAGQHDMSRQALDRGRGTDTEVMNDLGEAYTAELDRQVIAGTGANGQHLGLLSTTNVATITVTSANGVTQIRQIAGAASRVHSNRFMAAQVIVVHPRRWAFWVQSTDSQGRPLVTPRANGPQNAYGVGDLTAANGIVGDLYGLPVLADPNIPTTLSYDVTQSSNTDPIIVTRASDLRLYEDDPMPRRVRFEETIAGSLTVKIVAFDYSAFTAGRYATASVVLAGSGLTIPAFGS